MSHISHAPTSGSQELAGGEILKGHRHHGHQLVSVSAGVLVVETSHGSWVAASDRAVWIPAGTWHQHRAHGASTIHTVGFDGERPPLAIDRPAIVPVGALLSELLVALGDRSLSLPECERLRRVICDRLRRSIHEPISLPAPIHPRLVSACAIALEDLSTPIGLSALARRADTTERTLSRLFRDEMGMSYPQWRAQARALHAMVLLAEGRSVTDTATRCGWSTTSAFIDSFRRAYGQTPGSLRNSAPV